jgi:glutamate synthase domain-containing protein 3
VVKAALLGAERYGFGTAALIALGCKMARQCHNNTCPVGIATQAEDLRAKYFGTPEMLVSFLMHIAWEVREILAWMGYASLDEIVGRADLLRQIEGAGDERWRGVDLSSLIAPARPAGAPPSDEAVARERTLDETILHDLGDALTSGEGYAGEYAIHNTDRTVGARVSGRIARMHGDRGLPGSTINLTFRGSAGASFGAWLLDGVRMELIGEANDHVAKGMTGGEIAIRRATRPGAQDRDWVTAGDSVLYGATGGSLFIAGTVGERFAVRNSGASAVVEGVGQHGCEYMTGGVVVVLGPTGRNFAAGMSGGTAFVFDESGDFSASLNGESVASARVTSDKDVTVLRTLVERHLERTRSKRALDLLGDWERALPLFWKVAPGPTRSARERRVARGRTSRIRHDVSPVTLEISP